MWKYSIPKNLLNTSSFFIRFLLFIVFIIVTYLLFQNQIHNFLGEKIFLKFHYNNLAIKILQTVPNTRQDYYNNFLLGRLYFVENNLQQSVNYYTKSIALNSLHKESYYGRGLAYGFMGTLFLEDAKHDFQKYLELEEEEWEKTNTRAYGVWAGYNDLAWVFFLQHDFANAEKAAKMGLDISPENPWLLNMLSVSLIEQGKCKEAYPFIQKAEILAAKITPEQFGQAYTGDNKNWWPKGLNEMKKTLEHNKWLCAKVI